MDIAEKINRMSEDIDLIKKSILRMSKSTDKRLRRIDVARKLGITEETLDNWRDVPEKKFPIRGADGKWSEMEIEEWISGKKV